MAYSQRVDADTLHDEVTRIFRAVFNDPSLFLRAETSAADVDGWTSLTHVHLVVEMEKHFGIRCVSGELQDLQNVGEFESLIARKLARAFRRARPALGGVLQPSALAPR